MKRSVAKRLADRKPRIVPRLERANQLKYRPAVCAASRCCIGWRTMWWQPSPAARTSRESQTDPVAPVVATSELK